MPSLVPPATTASGIVLRPQAELRRVVRPGPRHPDEPALRPGPPRDDQGAVRRGDERRWYASPSSASSVRRYVLDGDHPRLGFTPPGKPRSRRSPPTRFASCGPLPRARQPLHRRRRRLRQGEDARELERAFAGWRTAADKERVFITRDARSRPGVSRGGQGPFRSPPFVITQHLAVDRTAPAGRPRGAGVMNDILGGSGFRSRLIERTALRRGADLRRLSFTPPRAGRGCPGAFSVAYQTKAASVAARSGSCSRRSARSSTSRSPPEVRSRSIPGGIASSSSSPTTSHRQPPDGLTSSTTGRTTRTVRSSTRCRR